MSDAALNGLLLGDGLPLRTGPVVTRLRSAVPTVAAGLRLHYAEHTVEAEDDDRAALYRSLRTHGEGSTRYVVQLIITDGNDPIITPGNNVQFCYKDMQWTTGAASQGVNGFGGTPATVGVNRGNGVDYIQIGRYDQAGARVIVAPYDYPDQGAAGALPSGVQMALVSWHRLQTCTSIDAAAAFGFSARYAYPAYGSEAYLGEAPEPGAQM